MMIAFACIVAVLGIMLLFGAFEEESRKQRSELITASIAFFCASLIILWINYDWDRRRAKFKAEMAAEEYLQIQEKDIADRKYYRLSNSSDTIIGTNLTGGENCNCVTPTGSVKQVCIYGNFKREDLDSSRPPAPAPKPATDSAKDPFSMKSLFPNSFPLNRLIQ